MIGWTDPALIVLATVLAKVGFSTQRIWTLEWGMAIMQTLGSSLIPLLLPLVMSILNMSSRAPQKNAIFSSPLILVRKIRYFLKFIH